MKILILLLLSTQAFAKLPPAGVYKHAFKNATMDGHKYDSEDVLEIVRLSDTAYYFRMDQDFANGHQCQIYGVAIPEKDELVYRSLEKDDCVLRIGVKDGAITTKDDGEKCTPQSCGARGYLGDGRPTNFLLKKRRDIRYMDRLMKSNELTSAKAEYAKSYEAIKKGIPLRIADAENRLWGWIVYNDIDRIKEAFARGLKFPESMSENAASTASPELLKFLLANGMNKNVLEKTISRKKVANALILIDHGAKHEGKKTLNELLVIAREQKDVALEKGLIRRGADSK